MMHDAEKSDLPIVAGKPANKAARAAAEPVERRGGTEESEPEPWRWWRRVSPANGCAQHGPDPEPGGRVPGAGPPARSSWILDADIRAFFDSIDHDRLMQFVEHRIGDARILRLIQKWLKAGVLDEGRVEATPEGVPQGATISPLLANVYLHSVYDLWVQHWRRHRTRGDMIVVRYADDTIVGFEHKADAERFLADLRDRLAAFSLSLHPAKTRLIAFGRWAGDERGRRGEGKPDTFDFLGFTHISAKTRDGRRFQLRRKTQRRRLRTKLKAVKDALRRNWRATIDQQGRWLAAVIRGHMAYFAVPTNSPALAAFSHHLGRIWYRYLRRRSQRCRITWNRMKDYVARYFPPVRVAHPWPTQRFDAKHPR